MPPVNEWTIHETTDGGGGIHGCHIVQTITGYEFTHGTTVLASVIATATPFTFPDFVHKNLNWAIGALNLPPGNSASGSYASWPNEDYPGGTGPEEGDWTAQAGSGVPDEDSDDDTDEDEGEDADEMSVSA